MNCEEIKDLLSEYLDGELDQRERKLVEEHLENCPGCAEELDGLKDCLKNLGSLKNVEPPPDFLSQVHTRLEYQSAFKTAIKKIIFPIRFKIPLEVAGLAAAAVLIVYLLNISPEKQSVPPLQMTGSGISREGADKSLRITGATRSLSRSEEPMMVAGEKRMKPASPPAEGLPLLEETAPRRTDNDETEGGGTGAIELVLLIEPEARYAKGESLKSAALPGIKGKNLQQAKSLSVGAKREDTRKASPLTRLKELIAREGGEIISTEEMTDLSRRIAIKLPADRYRSFMENLSKIGELQPDRTVHPGYDEQTIIFLH
jgi:Putative zinc-finger